MKWWKRKSNMTHFIGNSGTLLKELWKVGPEIPNSWNNKLASANLFLCYSADTRCKNTRFRDHCSQTWLCTHPRIGRTGTWVKKEQSDVGNMAKEQWLFYLKISNSMVSSLHADFPLCSEPWMILVCEFFLYCSTPCLLHLLSLVTVLCVAAEFWTNAETQTTARATSLKSVFSFHFTFMAVDI